MSATNWVVKALVEATPISGPARVINTNSDSRVNELSGTLQIARECDTPQRRASRSAALAHAEHVAQQVGLAGQLDKLALNLTVAGRKRLELARALATGPQLLLLDEVLAGLNPQEITEMIPVIRHIRDSGVTVLMIEHVMQAVMTLAESVYVLSNGQLIAQGTPQQVTSDTRVIEAYLGQGTAARLRKAAEAGHA